MSQLALPLVAIVVLGESAFAVAHARRWSSSCRSSSSRCRRGCGSTVCRAGRSSSPPTSSAPWRSQRCRSRYWLDALTIWQLYVVGFVVGVGTVFFDVAYQSYLPTLVKRDS